MLCVDEKAKKEPKAKYSYFACRDYFERDFQHVLELSYELRLTKVRFYDIIGSIPGLSETSSFPCDWLT